MHISHEYISKLANSTATGCPDSSIRRWATSRKSPLSHTLYVKKSSR